tara:strand:+ start:63 stop:404 length:342 start_codon:yes stop_codon:yes gene_type:complete
MTTLTLTEERYIIHAALESTKSDLVSRHGSVIVGNGKILGRGHNSSRTQSRDGFIDNTCSCHAEIAAIRNVFQNYNDKKVTKSACKNNLWVLRAKNIQKNHTLCRENRHKWKL